MYRRKSLSATSVFRAMSWGITMQFSHFANTLSNFYQILHLSSCYHLVILIFILCVSFMDSTSAPGKYNVFMLPKGGVAFGTFHVPLFVCQFVSCSEITMKEGEWMSDFLSRKTTLHWCLCETKFLRNLSSRSAVFQKVRKNLRSFSLYRNVRCQRKSFIDRTGTRNI